jgi:hypothetical protein
MKESITTLKGINDLGDFGVDQSIMLKWISEKRLWRFSPDTSGSRQWPVKGSCKHNNEMSYSFNAKNLPPSWPTTGSWSLLVNSLVSWPYVMISYT